MNFFIIRNRKKPRLHRELLSLAQLGLALALLTSCSLLKTRPVQEMSDTSAAIKAAREVQADSLAPELFRQANEWFFRAKREYKIKNFSIAEKYARKARYFAEQAELESMKSGARREEYMAPDPLSDQAVVSGSVSVKEAPPKPPQRVQAPDPSLMEPTAPATETPSEEAPLPSGDADSGGADSEDLGNPQGP